jgi:hypothetical protein
MEARILSYIHERAVYPGAEYTTDGAPPISEVLGHCTSLDLSLEKLLEFSAALLSLVTNGTLIVDDDNCLYFVAHAPWQ